MKYSLKTVPIVVACDANFVEDLNYIWREPSTSCSTENTGKRVEQNTVCIALTGLCMSGVKHFAGTNTQHVSCALVSTLTSTIND